MQPSDSTLLTCLHQMVAEDPNGAEAVRQLRRWSAMQGTFNRAAVIGMASKEISESRANTILETLCQWQAIQTDGKGHYSLSPGITSLFPPNRDHESFLRHFNHYEKEYRGAVRRVEDNPIEEDWPNLRAALKWGTKHDYRAASHFLHRFFDVMRATLDPHEALALLQYFADHRPQVDKYLEARLYDVIGDIYMRLENAAAAREAYEQALALYQLSQAQTEKAYTFSLMGSVARRLKRYAQAYAFYERAAERYTKEGSPQIVFQMNEYQAEIAFDQNNVDLALTHHEARLLMHEQNSMISMREYIYLQFAKLAARYGHVALARHNFAFSLLTCERMESLVDTKSKALWGWGQLEYAQGNKKAGCALCLQAVRLSDDDRVNADDRKHRRAVYDNMTCENNDATDKET